MNKKRIIKSIILPSELEKAKWSYTLDEDIHKCDDCGSMIFYIKKRMGVVLEDHGIQIVNNLDTSYYSLREIGLVLYCAECGGYHEDYFTFQYDKDNVVCDMEDLDYSEMNEVQYFLGQWNQKKDYTSLYKTPETNLLKEKLMEFEKKHERKGTNKKNTKAN